MLPLEWLTRAQKLNWSDSDIYGLISLIDDADTVTEITINAVSLSTLEKFTIGGVGRDGLPHSFTTQRTREWKWYRSTVPESIISASVAVAPTVAREPIITLELCDCKLTARSKRHDVGCEIRAREFEEVVTVAPVVSEPEPTVAKPVKSAKLDKARVLPGQVKLF